jgi:hypothetical protein
MTPAELSGPALDLAVAKLQEGFHDIRINNGYCWIKKKGNWHSDIYSPSTNWSQGGPLIEELIDLGWEPSRESTKEPVRFTNAWSESVVSGPTLLIATCQAYVAAKGG